MRPTHWRCGRARNYHDFGRGTATTGGTTGSSDTPPSRDVVAPSPAFAHNLDSLRCHPTRHRLPFQRFDSVVAGFTASSSIVLPLLVVCVVGWV